MESAKTIVPSDAAVQLVFSAITGDAAAAAAAAAPGAPPPGDAAALAAPLAGLQLSPAAGAPTAASLSRPAPAGSAAGGGSSVGPCAPSAHGGGNGSDPRACPPYAVTAACGKRPIMEDTYAACPDIAELPRVNEDNDAACVDRLPRCGAADLAEASSSSSGGSGGVDGGGVDGGGGGGRSISFSSSFGGGSSFGERGSSVTVCSGGSTSGGCGGGESGDCATSLSSNPAAHQAAEDRVDRLHFFGVYDGHGGVQAAQHCAVRLHHHLGAALRAVARRLGTGAAAVTAAAPAAALDSAQEEGTAEDAAVVNGGADGSGGGDGAAAAAAMAPEEAALHAAFLKTDAEFAADGAAGLVGTTALCALVGAARVWVANCGDSRAVLVRGGRAVQVTDDHKPEREDEAARVEKAGGQVLYWNGHRVMGVLAMSRAIGDHCLRPYVIPDPEVTVLRRHARDEILLLASDGLWDVMPNQEAADLAMRCIRRARSKGASPKAAVRVAASILAKAAVDRGSRDNVTVMVVDLARGGSGQPPAPAPAPQPAAAAEPAAAAAAAAGESTVPAAKACVCAGCGAKCACCCGGGSGSGGGAGGTAESECARFCNGVGTSSSSGDAPGAGPAAKAQQHLSSCSPFGAAAALSPFADTSGGERRGCCCAGGRCCGCGCTDASRSAGGPQ